MTCNLYTMLEDLKGRSKTSDSAEQHALVEFLVDQLFSIQHDLDNGNYAGEELTPLVRQQLLESLDQFEEHIGYLRKYIKEYIK